MGSLDLAIRGMYISSTVVVRSGIALRRMHDCWAKRLAKYIYIQIILSNTSNRLISDQDEPTYVDALRGVGVRQIACGSGHTVVLTTEGEVYTWGRGDDGRLGHGDNGWKYVPRITQSLAGQVVCQVTCGSYHTAAVTGNGDLYTWYETILLPFVSFSLPL